MPATTARSLPRSVPQRSRTSRLATLLPNSAEEFFRRRLTEFNGLAQIAVAVALIAALATFHAGDPSWNVALPPVWARHIHNLLGLGGAYFADIFIQTLGLAAYLLPLAIAAWGARLLRHRQRVPLWRRLIILFPALLVSSATLALLKPFPAWPLATSLGGSVGQAILAESAKAIGGLIGGGGIWLAWPLITILTVVMLSATFGIRFADWRAAFGGMAGAIVVEQRRACRALQRPAAAATMTMRRSRFAPRPRRAASQRSAAGSSPLLRRPRNSASRPASPPAARRPRPPIRANRC